MSIYLLKRCGDPGCLNDAHVGLQLAVPTMGQPIGSPNYLTVTLGVYSCAEHFHKIDADVIKALLSGAMMQKFRQAAEQLGRRPPDFRHTFIEGLPMNHPSLKRHERAKHAALKG